MAEFSAKSCKVVPAVTDGMIFKDKLCSHGSSEAKREWRGPIQFLVAEGADCVGCFPAVFEQKPNGLVTGSGGVFDCMFSVDLGYGVPGDIDDTFPGCNGLRDADLDGINAGHVMNDESCGPPLLSTFCCRSGPLGVC